ncbi:MAG: carbamoyltransferase [Kiritimatiellae bacterium]|nr:carbamoyltransferase [Kiritimatiellia bacterium]
MAKMILGISAFYHDSAAALLVDDKIVAAAQDERFTRKKQDSSFPSKAVEYVLSEAGISVSDLDAIAFYDKPLIKFERLLETYHAFAPRGLKSFLAAMPVWIKEKLFMRKMLWEELEEIEGSVLKKKPKLLFPEHHLSHAASAFYPSPFEKAAILTIDGVGEWTTTAIALGEGSNITMLRELSFPHSVGLLYSAFTYYCGFKVNSGEYKLMGLAPYGIDGSERVEGYKKKILTELVDVKDDGSIILNMSNFDYATGMRMCNDSEWERIFGLKKREQESGLTQEYMDLALAGQQVIEDIIVRLAKTAKEITGCKNLVMAGGVALNCVANGKLEQMGIFDEQWYQPAAGDAGGALGAAYAAYYLGEGVKRSDGGDRMQGAYLGPEYSDAKIKIACKRNNAHYQEYGDFDELCRNVSKLLDAGKVVGWFQGRMEWGPRALGNRSILGDARSPEMQKKLNLKIKYREGFRPFAPSVLEEDVGEYFDLDTISPYMMIVAPVKEERRKSVPEGYGGYEMMKRLYQERSDIPAITHVDFSARVQTVSKNTNKRYHRLIETFKEHTGYGLLVNTSFNVRGEPIVCTPDDAYRCFMRTEMDYLVMGNIFLNKEDQPTLLGGDSWKQEFVLD